VYVWIGDEFGRISVSPLFCQIHHQPKHVLNDHE